jgi:probable rRNA maturation factor
MMGDNIFFHSECEFEPQNTQKRSKWIEGTICQEEKEIGELNYIFCSDEYLLGKNQEFLDHNTYTDIITFDYCVGGVISGDVFISIDRVKENANTFKVDFNDELDRVLIHGALHLIGYQDKTKEEQKQMRAKEDFYLSLRP